MNNLDRELAEVLAALRNEALPEGALATVRAGVRGRIEAGRRQRVWTAWLSLATAAAAVWAILAISWTTATLSLVAPRTPEVASIAWVRPPALREEARLKPGRSLKAAPPRSTAYTELAKVRRGRDMPGPKARQEEQTQFMRIITDDPNVVILWAMNSKGETR